MKRKQPNRAVFGIRIISDAGAIRSEIWLDPEIDEATITSYGANYTPLTTAKSTIGKFLKEIEQIRSERA